MKGIRPEAVRRGLVWAAAMFVWSCGSSTDVSSGSSGGVASIVVTPPTPSISIGGEIPLQATAQDASGQTVTGVSIVWSVQDSKIAKVSASGVVTGLAVGTTQVAANANGKSGIAAVTVMKTPVASVVVLPEKIDGVAPGTKTPLNGIAYDAAQNPLTDRTIIWTTSNELVATVDAAGVVTAVGTGTATITGTVEGKSDASTITVAQAPVATVEVQPNPLLMSVGQSTQMIAVAKSSNGTVLTGRAVTWVSSDQNVATIDAQGKLSAVAAGTTTITATSEGKSGTSAVTISTTAVGSVTVQPATPSVVQGQNVQLTAIVKDILENVTNNRAVTWSSSNTAIATVNQAGLVTGVAAGSATITATSEGKTGNATLTVLQIPVASIAIDPPGVSVTAGKTSQLTATVKDANGNTLTGRTITWSSNLTAIATVSQTGLVTGVAVGNAVITATSEGKSATANVNVLSPILAVASVTVSPSAPSIIAGQTAPLTATVKDISGAVVTDRGVSWSSSNESVAVASSSGIVGGVAPGAATITATVEGKSGTAAVTILPVPVGSVDIAPTATNVIIGTTSPLAVTVKDANGTVVTDRAVTWSSSDNGIARVSGTGVVTAVAFGTATITARSESKSGTASVTVIPVPVGSVTVSPPANAISIGGSAQFSATVKDQNGTTVTNRVVTWASSNDAVATISSSGRVTGIAAGNVTITATSEGKSGTAALTVSPVPVGTVTVTPPSASVVKGQTTTLTVVVRDQNGTVVTNRALTWSSSNEAIATVSSSGVVTGVALGNATITATSEGKSDGSSITVTPTPVASVTLSPPSLNLSTTQTATLTATVKDANGATVTDRQVQWSSSNPGVAQVTQGGVVTAVVPGTATITATSEGKSGTSTINVSLLPVATVTVAPSPASVQVGGTTQLTATTKDALGAVLNGRTVTWSSGNTNAATVSQSGLVTGVGVGTAVITATSEGKNGTSTVTVSAAPPAPVATVTLAPPTATIATGATTTFTPTLKDAQGNTLTGRAVTWQSSNTSAATVNSSGVVTGAGAGTSTITATSEGKNGIASVTVTAPPPEPVATVTLAPATATIVAGGTQQLTPTLKDAGGNVLTGRTVTWQSSNTSAANVSSSGLVTGAGAGTTTITATSEGKNGTSTITVTVPAVNTVAVQPNPINVNVGSTVGAAATLKDANGNTLTGRTVTWQSNNTSVATVDAAGVVTGRATGSATLTATSEGKSGTATINVTAAPVSTVVIAPNDPTIKVNRTLQMTATLTDAGGNTLTGRTVGWSTSNPNVFTVSSSGLVNAVKKGNAVLTATSEGKSDTVKIMVVE